MSLGELTWSEVGATTPILLVPLGATEQHGPHLPLDTDTRIAVAVAHRLADRHDDVVVAPALAIGASGEHLGFPGTLSLGREVFEAALVELTRSADAFAGVVWLNAHGGNVAPVDAAARRLLDEGRAVLSLPCWVPDGDPHAGRTETAMLLHLCPELVRVDRAEPGATAPWSELGPRIRAEGVAAVSPNGVLGDPTGATAREGERLLDALVDRLDEQLRTWRSSRDRDEPAGEGPT